MLGSRVRRIEGETETRIEKFATTRKENKAKEKRAKKKRGRDAEGVHAGKEPNEIKHRGGSPLLYRAVNEK